MKNLLQYLKDNDGVCDLGDKSEAEDIKRRFQVSKKVYKRAVGDLYTPIQLDIIKNNLDPELYPNVNWIDPIMKKTSLQENYYASARDH